MFIPKVIWYARIQTTPLERLYDSVLESSDRLSGRTVVVSKLRNKALLHLAIQARCIGNKSNNVAFEPTHSRYFNMGSGCYEDDSDL